MRVAAITPIGTAMGRAPVMTLWMTRACLSPVDCVTFPKILSPRITKTRTTPNRAQVAAKLSMPR